MAYLNVGKIEDGWQLPVYMYDLSYQNEDHMTFRLYQDDGLYNGNLISEANSWNTSGTASVKFNISSVSPGRVKFFVRRVVHPREVEYPVGDPFYVDIPYPKPPTQPMTAYIIDEIRPATDTSVTVTLRVNGYGSISMYSETWKQDGFKEPLDKITIEENDYDIQDGKMKTVELSYRFNNYGRESKFDMYGERGLPLGTVELKFSQNPNRDDWIGNADILCIGTYFYQYYGGQYSATLSPITAGYSVPVATFVTVRRDWQLLINVFYYLSSTTVGALKFGSRADYIPRKDDLLTADMYNGLLDIANSCLAEIKYKYGWSARNLNPTIPDKVSRGDIISRYFIFHLGKAANQMGEFIQKQVNDNLIGRWSELR